MDNFGEDGRNKLLDAQMVIEKEDGNLSSMLASLQWNYDLMKAIDDNPQVTAYTWSLSLNDDGGTFSTSYTLAWSVSSFANR